MWQRLDARPRFRRPWIWRVAVLAVIVIMAVTIPTAVVLSRRSSTPRANVLVPLYVYPASGAWDPLYKAINSNLDFTIVVNPANGPGNALDDNYVAGIAKLRQPNVRLLGYVPLGYGNNSIDQVCQQVQTWSSWSIDSIFYDESPHIYTADSAAYLDKARAATSFAVFNAGTVPDAGLYTSSDTIIAFEESYTTFQASQDKLASLANRDHTGIIVHSVPASANVKDLVNEMSAHAEYIFATDLTIHDKGNPYEAFGSIWTTFIASMP